MNIVLPDQRGKLPDDPSCSNVGHVGVEFEYVQGDLSQFAWRGRLADDGIYTWQTGVAPREIISGEYTIPNNPRRFIHSTQRLYTESWALINDTDGNTNETCHAEEWLQEAFPAYFDDESNQAIRSNGRYTTKFMNFTGKHLWEKEPPPNRAFWNLGTDPTAGLELRSPPMEVGTNTQLKASFGVFDRVLKSLHDNGASISSGCGTHIHTDVAHMTRQDQGRMVLIYRLIERLMCVPLEPSRYHNGYNRPYFTNEVTTPYTNCHALLDVNHPFRNAHNSSRANFLNTAAINRHGTMEWRHLEGVEDSQTIKCWITLVLRFIQAATQGDTWNTQFTRMPVLKVDAASIRAFLKFLDLNRKGLSDELNDAKEWYMERAKKFSDSTSYKHHLNSTGVCIKTLRTADIIPDLGRFIVAARNQEDVTALEMGKRFNKALLSVLSYELYQGPNSDGDLGTEFLEALLRNLTNQFGEEFTDNYENGNFEVVGQYIQEDTRGFNSRFLRALTRTLAIDATLENGRINTVDNTLKTVLLEEEQCVVL